MQYKLDSDYIKGFLDKCAAMNVDPRVLDTYIKKYDEPEDVRRHVRMGRYAGKGGRIGLIIGAILGAVEGGPDPHAMIGRGISRAAHLGLLGTGAGAITGALKS